MSDPANENTNGQSDGDLDDPRAPGAPSRAPGTAEGEQDRQDLPPGAETREH